MFAQDQTLINLERAIQEEVIDPIEKQSQEKLKLLQQVYPQATMNMALGIFFILGLMVTKFTVGPKTELEDRLNRAADRFIFWDKKQVRKKRRKKWHY